MKAPHSGSVERLTVAIRECKSFQQREHGPTTTQPIAVTESLSD